VTTKPTDPPADSTFSFSPEDWNKLADTIPASVAVEQFSDLAWELESIVGDFKTGLFAKESHDFRQRRQQSRLSARRLKRHVSAAIATLDALDDDSRRDFDSDGLNGGRDPTVDCDSATKSLKTILHAATVWEATTTHRGRPETPMSLLAWSVGYALRDRGLPLKKSREGLLSQTLAIVFDAADCKVPEDLFYYVERVVAAFRVGTKNVPSVK
jgi:hypothetical protein